MRKPFAALAGAFGHCRTDEDKVKLLSVLSNATFSITDEEETMSNVSNGDSSTSASNNDKNLRRKCQNDKRKSVEFDVGALDAAENAGQQRRLPAGSCETRITNEEQTQKLAADEHFDDVQQQEKQQHDWTFTLYDFDAKGRVTREDIFSLVRSIYEVLINAKIPIIRACQHDSTTGRPIGAFKIKLSVIADNAAEPEVDISSAKHRKSNVFVKKSNHQKRDNESAVSTVDELNDEDEEEEDEEEPMNNNDVINRLYEEIPLIRRPNVKKATKRHHDSGKPSTSPIPYGKLHRHSVADLFDCSDHLGTENGGKAPPCTYRDYVNLSEVENCCSTHHHNQAATTSTAAAACNGKLCVHHIRHCDRHCHCPPSTVNGSVMAAAKLLLNNSPPCNDPCLMSLEKEYEKYLHRKLTSGGGCCNSSGGALVDGRFVQSPTSAALNERARAYYSHQRAAALTKQQKYNNNTNSDFVVDLKDFAAAAARHESLVKLSLHQRKHRNREKDRIRAMQQVREWILNDFDADDKAGEEKAATEDLEKIAESHFADVGLGKMSEHALISGKMADQHGKRGEADGLSPLLVEHKHVHEHHHYHHF